MFARPRHSRAARCFGNGERSWAWALQCNATLCTGRAMPRGFQSNGDGRQRVSDAAAKQRSVELRNARHSIGKARRGAGTAGCDKRRQCHAPTRGGKAQLSQDVHRRSIDGRCNGAALGGGSASRSHGIGSHSAGNATHGPAWTKPSLAQAKRGMALQGQSKALRSRGVVELSTGKAWAMRGTALRRQQQPTKERQT